MLDHGKVLGALLATVFLAVSAMLAPGVAQAARHCGSVHVAHGYPPLQVSVVKGSAPCGQARAVMRSLYTRHHRLHCFRTNEQCRNGQPTDGANTVVYIAGWQCATGAGGGGCSRGPHNAFAGEFVETSAEKHTRTEREATENRKTVLECENNPELVLMQEGASGHYIYECLSEQKLASECRQGVCRQPMYEEYEGRAKWTKRVAEACHAINGVTVANETREQNGVVEYECEAGASLAWVSLPYIPPTVYAEPSTP